MRTFQWLKRETATSVKAASAERRRPSVLEGLERAIGGTERIRSATLDAVARGIFPAEARAEAIELLRRGERALAEAASALEKS